MLYGTSNCTIACVLQKLHFFFLFFSFLFFFFFNFPILFYNYTPYCEKKITRTEKKNLIGRFFLLVHNLPEKKRRFYRKEIFLCTSDILHVVCDMQV